MMPRGGRGTKTPLWLFQQKKICLRHRLFYGLRLGLGEQTIIVDSISGNHSLDGENAMKAFGKLIFIYSLVGEPGVKTDIMSGVRGFRHSLDSVTHPPPTQFAPPLITMSLYGGISRQHGLGYALVQGLAWGSGPMREQAGEEVIWGGLLPPEAGAGGGHRPHRRTGPRFLWAPGGPLCPIPPAPLLGAQYRTPTGVWWRSAAHAQQSGPMALRRPPPLGGRYGLGPRRRPIRGPRNAPSNLAQIREYSLLPSNEIMCVVRSQAEDTKRQIFRWNNKTNQRSQCGKPGNTPPCVLLPPHHRAFEHPIPHPLATPVRPNPQRVLCKEGVHSIQSHTMCADRTNNALTTCLCGWCARR